MAKRSKTILKSQHCYQKQDVSLPYELIRSNARRTYSIIVDEKANIRIYTPIRAPMDYIESFIQEKLNWIQKCIVKIKENQAIVAGKKFAQGGEFLFLGRKYPLDIVEEDLKRVIIGFDGGKWRVRLPREIPTEHREIKIREKLIQWYRLQAEEILGGRIFHYSRLIGVAPKKIAIRSQKRMWGCCDYYKQTIHLNWQIILSPLKVVDYVVIHELCHLVHPNHGKRFWQKVEKHMPDFKEYKKWLSVNHAEMQLP